MTGRPDPTGDAARIRNTWSDPLRLVLDVNVYIDAREEIGYDLISGQLRQVTAASLSHPSVAVIRAEQLDGHPLEIVHDDIIRGELFHALRHGYVRETGTWNGAATPREAAVLLKELLGLVKGQLAKHPQCEPAELPDPPLNEHEVHDRQIWAQAQASSATLVTNDTKLLEAIWQQHQTTGVAVRPVELVAVSQSD